MDAVILFLAAMLAVSAGHKLAARGTLAPIAARLGAVPPALGPALLLAAATVEALAAILLLVPPLAGAGAICAAALWSGYSVALWRRRGETLDCGCDLVRRARPVTAVTAARPLLLAGLAAGSTLTTAPPVSIETPFAALALLALWHAAAELAAASPRKHA